MINATVRKFGYPATLVAEYVHWLVLLRPVAATLGSLVLASKHDATAYGDLPAQAHAEQGEAVRAIEQALRAFTAYEKIDYLMLMMVDPHVHFHVVPRYAGVRKFGGREFSDSGWPSMPDLASARTLDVGEVEAMTAAVRTTWPGSASVIG